MTVMATKASLKLYFRTTPELRGAQELLKGKLRSSKALSSTPRYVSSDAIINSLLLWASEQNADDLAECLLPYLERFREVWREVLKGSGEGEQDESGDMRVPVNDVQKEGPPRKGVVRLSKDTLGARNRTASDNANVARENRQSRQREKDESTRRSTSSGYGNAKKEGRKPKPGD